MSVGGSVLWANSHPSSFPFCLKEDPSKSDTTAVTGSTGENAAAFLSSGAPQSLNNEKFAEVFLSEVRIEPSRGSCPVPRAWKNRSSCAPTA
jgi:hypothetical protein